MGDGFVFSVIIYSCREFLMLTVCKGSVLFEVYDFFKPSEAERPQRI